MRKVIRKTLFLIFIIVVAASAFVLTACGGNTADTQKLPVEVINGGFETSDLSGWIIESGEAFGDDNVSSRKTFSYSYDTAHKQIPINQTGNWYLDGKGYDYSRSHGYTGSIRSRNFVLSGDGTVSVKIAGGALVTRKGENAPLKSKEKICYVGVYTADDDKLVHKFTNTYFFEHTEDYVNVNDYENGSCCTDNFYRYTADLSEYIGKEMYIRIVDNDTDVYYGYISVDDIRVGDADAQSEGAYFEKTRKYVADADAPSEYEIKNGDFETGSLAGWTVVSGRAFSHNGVNANAYWWNENIPYCRDGNYHYGFYKPTETGVMRSSEFVLGGSGYISYKLGGCGNNNLTYLRFMVKNGDTAEEVARYSNFKFWNYQFPYVQNGMRLLNLVQYYADFSAYLGRTMYIEVVDENTSASDLDCITLDSVRTYWESKPQWYTSVAHEAKVDPDSIDIEPDSPYQLTNGTFETGDLTGWIMEGNIGVVSSDYGWWDANFPYNKKGTYLFTGIAHEGNMGTLTSDAFELGGIGVITFRMGGGANPKQVYISILDADDGDKELARFANSRFSDKGTVGLNVNSFLANMVQYKVDLTEIGIELGTNIKIQVVDKAVSNWGLVTVDSFITYYENQAQVPSKAFTAEDIKPDSDKIFGEDDPYQILNGDFETGDLTGWTVTSGTVGAAVSSASTFWNEGIPYNQSGMFHFDGWQANDEEPAAYSLRSEDFTLGGSGRISFKMAGKTAQLKVYKKDGTLVASYDNTAFADVHFPKVDGGCRLATMTTYVADLSAYLNEELYIEICDRAFEEDEEGWGVAFFDEIITYYEVAPTVGDMYDTVELNAATSSDGVAKQYNIPWLVAVNTVNKN